MLKKILQTDTDRATLLIRLMVGVIFLSEGIQKFIYPAVRGIGRFEGMGFPSAGFLANFVGTFEVLAGLLILFGVLTRAAALVTFTIMSVAIIVTKLPIAFAQSFGPFTLRELSTYGFWSMAHEMHTDFAMWLGSLFLLIKGGGRWSIDRQLTSKSNAGPSAHA